MPEISRRDTVLVLKNQAITAKARKVQTWLFMHPNCECLAYDILFGNGAPNATIGAVVTIISHHEIMPFWHNPDTATTASRWRIDNLCQVLYFAQGFIK